MGYTRTAAYQLHREDTIGSIETGKLADLVILDQNLFETNLGEIWKRKPSAVIMEGELIQGKLPEPD
jgi:predicted amidohydrolase YtcJ